VTDIAAILREHDLYYDKRCGDWKCDCDVFLAVKEEDAKYELTAHQAEKVWEALRAGAREEWGTRGAYTTWPERTEASARMFASEAGVPIVRRYVITTDWERV
jgi:hypothetical protein